MEVNQDVLLGKKTTTCLSCNNGKETFDKVFTVKGKDGKMYFGGNEQSRKNTKEDTISDKKKFQVDFNLKSQRDVITPTNHVSQPFPRSSSPSDPPTFMDLTNERELRFRVGKTAFDRARYQKQRKVKPHSSYGQKTQIGNNRETHSHLNNLLIRSNNTHSGQRLKKAKLPISFMVQDHMKHSGRMHDAYQSMLAESAVFQELS